MNRIRQKRMRLDRRQERGRRRVLGTPDRPRMAVYRSSNHIYAQVIDDTRGTTLAAASSQQLKVPGGNVEAAKAVGKAIAEKARAAQVDTVRFDRGGRLYHGRVKALADAAREAGLKF